MPSHAVIRDSVQMMLTIFACQQEYVIHMCACREQMIAFMHKCHAVTEQLMSCFAVGLGLDTDFFQEVSLLQCIHGCICTRIAAAV